MGWPYSAMGSNDKWPPLRLVQGPEQISIMLNESDPWSRIQGHAQGGEP